MMPVATWCPKRWLVVFLGLWGALPGADSHGLTVDEAIAQAKKNLPLYKAAEMKAAATESLYKASLAPYIPTIDGAAMVKGHRSTNDPYESRAYTLSLAYTLYDGGKRSANRDIAGLNLHVDREEIRKSQIDLEYSVKVAFYTAMGQRDILDQRRMQFGFAEKDHEVAAGRHHLGYVKRSDVLQALVRLEQARFNLIEAEGEAKKAIAELNSLMGLPLQSGHELAGSLEKEIEPPDGDQLQRAATKRPEIIQAESTVAIAARNKAVASSTIYPLVSLNSAYEKSSSGLSQTTYPEERTIGVTANWNFFEWGKYYKIKAAGRETDAAILRREETKRKILLDLAKVRDDFETSADKLRVADQQLIHADHNYHQALGEYKAGQGDILSLVQAESLLANAREQLTAARLAVVTVKALWEKTAGVTTAGPAQGAPATASGAE